jgi:hypothetical protein
VTGGQKSQSTETPGNGRFWVERGPSRTSGVVEAEREAALKVGNGEGAVTWQKKLDQLDAEQQGPGGGDQPRDPETGPHRETGPGVTMWGAGVRKPVTPPPDMNTLFLQHTGRVR